MTDPLTFHHTVLGNGLTLIGEHNPQAQTFAAGYFVATGSRDETPEVAGVSHFLEHMMFKGTERRSAEAINREFDELGASYNAYTSDERTVYYGAVLPERRERLLDLLSDMMRPALRESDFNIEKNVILEEIAMYEDRPNFKVFEEGNEIFYNGHPLGNSVLGSKESITGLTRDAMLRYFEARYAADNLLLTVAGHYDWDEVVAQVTEATRTWQPSGAERDHSDFSPATGHRILRDPKLKRVHVAAYARGVSAQDPRRYAASVLARVVGDSDGSRLYWALVDGGLADTATLSHDAADGVGAFVGYLSTGPEERERVLDIFRKTLGDTQASPPTASEWRRAQRKLATGQTLRGETPFGRLMTLGASYQATTEYSSVTETVERIMATTPEEGAAFLGERPFDSILTVSLEPEGA